MIQLWPNKIVAQNKYMVVLCSVPVSAKLLRVAFTFVSLRMMESIANMNNAVNNEK